MVQDHAEILKKVVNKVCDEYIEKGKKFREEWEFYMYKCCTDEVTGEKYGCGRVLDYIGVGWEDYPAIQLSLFDEV